MWSEYLSTYNWVSVKLADGSILRIMPFGFFSFAKLQRPGLLDEKALQEIKEVCGDNKVVSITIFPSQDQNEQVLIRSGYKQVKKTDIPSKTMLIDLQCDTNVLESRLSKSCKYSINRANREGVTTDYIENPSEQDMAVFHALVSKRGRKKNFFVQSLRDYQAKVRIFGHSSYLINVHDKNGDILGAKFFLGFEDNVWYIHGGTSEMGQSCKAGYKLMQDSTLYFKELNYKTLDLEGLADDRMKNETKGWLGYTHFKNKFGGDVVEYPLPYSKRMVRNIIF